MIRLPVHSDLPLFHDLEKGRLGLGRRPVDLVDQYDIAEDRPVLELEIAVPGIEHGSADDIAGHQVRGELDARKSNGDDPAQQFGGQRLGDAGDPFDQDMSIRQDPRQQ